MPWDCAQGAGVFEGFPESLPKGTLVVLTGQVEGLSCTFEAYAAALNQLAPAGARHLVLPVGFFEGQILGERVHAGMPLEEASLTVYRAFRETPQWAGILEAVREHDLQVAGGLMRYHAAGKELFARHLSAMHLEEADAIARLLGGTVRLRDVSPAARDSARVLVQVLARRTEGVERQYLNNFEAFIELERLRAEGADLTSWMAAERQGSLDYLASDWARGAPLVFWAGGEDAQVEWSGPRMDVAFVER